MITDNALTECQPPPLAPTCNYAAVGEPIPAIVPAGEPRPKWVFARDSADNMSGAVIKGSALHEVEVMSSAAAASQPLTPAEMTAFVEIREAEASARVAAERETRGQLLLADGAISATSSGVDAQEDVYAGVAAATLRRQMMAARIAAATVEHSCPVSSSSGAKRSPENYIVSSPHRPRSAAAKRQSLPSLPSSSDPLDRNASKGGGTEQRSMLERGIDNSGKEYMCWMRESRHLETKHASAEAITQAKADIESTHLASAEAQARQLPEMSHHVGQLKQLTLRLEEQLPSAQAYSQSAALCADVAGRRAREFGEQLPSAQVYSQNAALCADAAERRAKEFGEQLWPPIQRVQTSEVRSEVTSTKARQVMDHLRQQLECSHHETDKLQKKQVALETAAQTAAARASAAEAHAVQLTEKLRLAQIVNVALGEYKARAEAAELELKRGETYTAVAVQSGEVLDKFVQAELLRLNRELERLRFEARRKNHDTCHENNIASQLSAATTRAENAEIELQKLVGRLEQMRVANSALEEANTRTDLAEAEVRRLNGEIQRLNEELKSATQDARQQALDSNAHAQMSIEMQRLQGELERTRACTHQSLRAEAEVVGTLKEQLAAAHTRENALDTQLRATLNQHAIDTCKLRLTEIRASFFRIRLELDKTQTGKTYSDKVLEDIEHANNELSKLQEADMHADIIVVQAQRLNQALLDIGEGVQNFVISELAAAIARAEKADMVVSSCESMQQQNNEAAAAMLEEFKLRAEATEAECEFLVQELNGARSRADAADAACKSMACELEQLKKDLEASCAESKRLRLKNALDVSDEILQRLLTELDASANESEIVRQELANITQNALQAGLLEDDLQRLRSELDLSRMSLQQLKHKLESSKFESERLRQQSDNTTRSDAPANLVDETKRLTDELDVSNKALHQLQKDLNATKEASKRLSHATGTSDETLQRLRAELDSSKDESERLRRKMESTTQDAPQSSLLKDELQRLRSELDLSTKSLQQLRHELDSSRSESERLRQRLESTTQSEVETKRLRDEYDEARRNEDGERKCLKDALDISNEMLHRLRTELDASAEELTVLKNEADVSTKTLQTLRNELDASVGETQRLTCEIQVLKEALAKSQGDVDSLRKDLAVAQAKADTLQIVADGAAAKSYADAASEAKEQLARMQQILDEYKERYEVAGADAANAKSERDQALKLAERLQLDIEVHWTEEVKKSEGALAQAVADKTRAGVELERTQDEFEKAVKEVARLQQELEKAMEDKARAAAELEELKNKHEKAIKAELVQRRHMENQAKLKVKEATEEADAAKKDVAAAAKQVSALGLELEQQKQKLAAEQRRADAAEEALARLRKEHEEMRQTTAHELASARSFGEQALQTAREDAKLDALKSAECMQSLQANLAGEMDRRLAIKSVLTLELKYFLRKCGQYSQRQIRGSSADNSATGHHRVTQFKHKGDGREAEALKQLSLKFRESQQARARAEADVKRLQTSSDEFQSQAETAVAAATQLKQEISVAKGETRRHQTIASGLMNDLAEADARTKKAQSELNKLRISTKFKTAIADTELEKLRAELRRCQEKAEEDRIEATRILSEVQKSAKQQLDEANLRTTAAELRLEPLQAELEKVKKDMERREVELLVEAENKVRAARAQAKQMIQEFTMQYEQGGHKRATTTSDPMRRGGLAKSDGIRRQANSVVKTNSVLKSVRSERAP